MSKKRLTKTIADHAKYEGNGSTPCFVWDTEVPGFGIRIYPSGSKSFVITYRNTANKQRFMIVGKYGVLTVQQAREMAKEKLVSVLKGSDPLFERKNHAVGETFEEFCKTYIERYAKTEKKSWAEDSRRIEAYIVPNLGKMKLKHAQKSTIQKLHHEIGKHSIYEANRTLALISKVYNLAIEWGALEASFVNPAKNITKFKEKSRDRWLSEEELEKLNSALIQEQNIYAKSAIVLFLFTGLRKQELLTAKWSNLLTKGGNTTLLLPDTKAGEAQQVHLSREALSILETIPRASGNPYIFVGSKVGGHLVNIDKPWRRVREKAGLPDVRLHDLRRTLGSRLVQAGHSLKVVKETLRHKDLKTTEIYAHVADRQKIDAIEAQGTLLGGTFKDLINTCRET